ncbi:hypothetical protein FRC03_009750 [Tulasnella sp. 419]|nr:hypothetical protein FRC03_009750 [Tulasnella sp. 419]
MLSSFSQYITIPSPFSSNHPPPETPVSQPPADEDSRATSVDEPKEERQDVMTKQEQQEQPKRKDKKTIYETFIVVRPPPSKSNHPLNLQVQLVPLSVSSHKNESTDTVNSTAGAPLTRSVSNRSNRSSTSLYSTSNSMSSVSSISSSASSARRIIPLYNLSAHNVLTNTVTDAGTDAKVAKFAKRGIEIVGLGTLEGYEIRHVHSLDAVPSSSALRPPSVVEDGGMLSPLKRNQSPSKSPSVLSHTSNASNQNVTTPSSSNSHLSSEEPSTPTQQQVASTPKDTGSAKKLFGKIFKKKGADASPSSPISLPVSPSTPSTSIFSRGSATPKSNRLSFFSSTATPTTPTPRRGEMTENQGILTPPSSAFLSIPPTTPTPNILSSEVCGSLQPPVLGTQATLLYRAPPQPHSRGHSSGAGAEVTNDDPVVDIATPHGTKFNFTPPNGLGHHSYEWVIRRWIKKRDTQLPNIGGPSSEEVGLVGGLVAGVGNSLQNVMQNVHGGNFDGAGVEVKFEWSRGKGSKARAKEKERRMKRREGTTDISRPSSVYGMAVPEPPTVVRPSMDSSSRRSSSHSGGSGKDQPNRRKTNGTNGSAPLPAPAHEDQDDDGAESDPEDSDTPWTCTLWVGPITHPDEPSPVSTAYPTNFPATLKLKLGTMTPAPHHPKILTQLKMPYPLPDVDVEKCELVWDRVNGEEATPGSRGMMLSAEDIKDVVSVTGLWLIVREGFGGLERRRKGDGWKIRG